MALNQCDEQRIRTVLCAGLMILWMAAVVLMLRSYWLAEVYVYNRSSKFGTLVHNAGSLELKWIGDQHGAVNLNTDGFNFAAGQGLSRYTFHKEFGCSLRLSKGESSGWAAFRQPRSEWYGFYDKRAKKKQVTIVLADLIPLVALGVPALTWPGFLWMRHRRRKKCGQCRSCGYCLTGNVSGTCPECGVKIYSN
jgi:hypothetical protein